MRLICFPYAGGSAALYRGLAQLLPGFDVRAIELPGRGSRLREPPHRSMESLVECLLGELSDELDAPFALLGHSMGASICFELVCRLYGRARENVRHVFLSARAAPGAPVRSKRLHTLDDVAFKQGLRDLEGTRNEILESDEIMQLMMPALRADFTLIERYLPPPNRRIAVGITAFAGTRDNTVPVSAVEAWRAATSHSFQLEWVEGGHFYVHDSLPRMAAVIAATVGDPFRAVPLRREKFSMT